MKKYKLKTIDIHNYKMLRLNLGIFLILCLFESSIQQYSDEYCAKYVATFPLTMEACIDSSDANNESSILYKIMNETNVIIEGFKNNNCSGPETFTMTYSPHVCKNSMIITYDYPNIAPILSKTPVKKENWNEYIVLSGTNFASNQKRNILKSFKIPKKILLSEEIIKYIDSPKFFLSEFLIGFSAILFTLTFFILIIE
jgi:hypothetical protein